MTTIRFEWDEAKNAINKRKHGVEFEEAMTVFADQHALLLPDPEHSTDEDRFLLLGLAVSLRMLVVCHCYRHEDVVIRLISARRATKSERNDYTKRWRK